MQFTALVAALTCMVAFTAATRTTNTNIDCGYRNRIHDQFCYGECTFELEPNHDGGYCDAKSHKCVCTDGR
ncbi:unnamed protein product [Zymoseptoria tritici ST99CH_3D1]|nr:unnamed protein product [Zymoseptoria tritici ST99CH_3D1]